MAEKEKAAATSEEHVRKLSRVESQNIVAEINKTVENLSVVHQSYVNEINNPDQPSCDRLTRMREELNIGLSHLASLHDSLKKVLDEVEPDHKLVKEIDRVTAENKKIAAMVTDSLNDLTIKAKSQNIIVEINKTVENQCCSSVLFK